MSNEVRDWLYHSIEAGTYRAELRCRSLDKEDLDAMSDDEIDELLLTVADPTIAPTGLEEGT